MHICTQGTLITVYVTTPYVVDIYASLELGPEYAGDVSVVAPQGGPVALKEYRTVFFKSIEQWTFLGGYHLQRLIHIHSYISGSKQRLVRVISKHAQSTQIHHNYETIDST